MENSEQPLEEVYKHYFSLHSQLAIYFEDFLFFFLFLFPPNCHRIIIPFMGLYLLENDK